MKILELGAYVLVGAVGAIVFFKKEGQIKKLEAEIYNYKKLLKNHDLCSEEIKLKNEKINDLESELILATQTTKNQQNKLLELQLNNDELVKLVKELQEEKESLNKKFKEHTLKDIMQKETNKAKKYNKRR